MSALFAATYPERVSQLILFGGFARFADLVGAENMEKVLQRAVKLWGTGATINLILPSQAANQDMVNLFAKFERLSASPGAYKDLWSLNSMIDVKPILSTVRVPTLVLHRRHDRFVSVECGRDLAARIRARNISSTRLETMPRFFPAMLRRCMVTSRSSLPGIARVHRAILNVFWRRFCSRIS